MACEPSGYPVVVLTVAQVAQLWLDMGGSQDTLIAAVAVAYAESCGLSQYATSPAGALGLWQILDSNAASFGYQPTDLYDPRVNAWIAVQMSGGGRNWEAWDVAYAAGSSLTRRYFIGYPEAGSAAYGDIPLVSSQLGTTGGGGAGPPVNTSPGGGAPTLSGQPSPVVGQPTLPAPPPGQGGGFQPLPGWPAVNEPGAYGSGWDNLRQYLTSDAQDLYNLDQAMERSMIQAIGG